MRGAGRGLMYPNCWTNDRNETEYIFDVTIRDTGLTVQDLAPTRQSDDAWKLVDDFPRSVEISGPRFRAATARLFNWSKEHDCRFLVIMRDATGVASKLPYKAMRTLVEEHFYVKHVDKNASTKREPEKGKPQPIELPPPEQSTLERQPSLPVDR